MQNAVRQTSCRPRRRSCSASRSRRLRLLEQDASIPASARLVGAEPGPRPGRSSSASSARSASACRRRPSQAVPTPPPVVTTTSSRGSSTRRATPAPTSGGDRDRPVLGARATTRAARPTCSRTAVAADVHRGADHRRSDRRQLRVSEHRDRTPATKVVIRRRGGAVRRPDRGAGADVSRAPVTDAAAGG